MSSYKLYSNSIYNEYLLNIYDFFYKNLPIELCIIILKYYDIENSKYNDPEYNLNYNYPYIYDDFTLYSLDEDYLFDEDYN